MEHPIRVPYTVLLQDGIALGPGKIKPTEAKLSGNYSVGFSHTRQARLTPDGIPSSFQ